MTIHIPRWVLYLIGVFVLLLGAFLLGRGSGSESDNKPASAAHDASMSAPECSKKEARRGIERELLNFGDETGNLLDENGQRLRPDLYVEVIGCEDLNDDGNDELVVRADGVGAGGSHPMSWFLLEANEGKWKVISNREMPVPELKIVDGGVRETTPAYGSSDPFCCPSSERIGTVVFEEGQWVYEPAAGSPDRQITIDRATRNLASFGPLDAMTSTSSEAVDALGQPSYIGASGNETCPMTWSDLGLTIHFVNLGGQDSCLKGLIGSAILVGEQATQAGWVGPRGLHLGQDLALTRQQFPDTVSAPLGTTSSIEPPHQSNPWNLLSRPSPFSESGRTPTITGYFARDVLRQIDFFIGAGGE